MDADSAQARSLFRRALISWFARNGRDHPWRRTTDPYAVLVSELMLQQTTLAMVLERRYFEKWMERFPDPASLAAAPEEHVLKMWEGLGYYNRARNLRKAARLIVETHGGRFPETLPEIMALPGVGRYTAGAVLSFAFDRPAPIVDGNIARVLARLFDFGGEIDGPAGRSQLWEWAEALLPRRDARRYNSALMELGQRVCTPGRPSCDVCPVSQWCQAKHPENLPRKSPARAIVVVEEDVLLVRRGGKILLEQECGTRRKGLWKLPAVRGRKMGTLVWQGKYVITHHRVTLRIFAAGDPVRAAPGERWFDPSKLAAAPMPSPYRRALADLLFQPHAQPVAPARLAAQRRQPPQRQPVDAGHRV